MPGRPAPLLTKTLLFLAKGSTNRPGGARVPEGMPPEIVTNYGGRMFRAYDKATGVEVGAVYMPAQQSGSPMTYLVNDRQYIVVAVGGGNYSGEYIAFRLPE